MYYKCSLASPIFESETEMENFLYYHVNVNVGSHYARFVLPSNLPFPSPIGTEIFLACEDEHLLRGFRGAEVIGYEHQTPYNRGIRTSSLGSLHMILLPPEDKDLRVKIGYLVHPESYGHFRYQMIEFGWKVEYESPELQPKEEE